jgi:2-polyprenyl-3-methyl-5-hydroxy-6-metoxy-1,4-benzoquinol methylase
MDNKHCRFCGKELKHSLVDLGLSPLANGYLHKEDLERGEMFFPLRVNVCDECFLTQAEIFEMPENIFSDYMYFSSFSESWLEHCKKYVDMIAERLSLNKKSRVLEVACNDGYLLQYFLPYGIPVKGVEPAENVAKEARAKGIDVDCCFFGTDTAKEMVAKEGTFDLVIGNNVLAHVPDIDGFVGGLGIVLSPLGTITMEFPHLLNLINKNQFDTIYHEHFHYLSLLTVKQIFAHHGMKIYDVEQLPTHGGSLRIYATHKENEAVLVKESVTNTLEEEKSFGLSNIETYTAFARKVEKIKIDALKMFADIKRQGKHIAAFGAAAKGNTFLNYCGIKADMIDFVVDSNVYKQGLLLPGSLIPIVGIEALREKKPEYLVILPWNLKDEISEVASFVREWGCKFITCIPEILEF